MVGADGVGYLFLLTILLGQVTTYAGMSTFDLMIDRLADVMEKPCPLGKLDVNPELRGHYPGKVGDL